MSRTYAPSPPPPIPNPPAESNDFTGDDLSFMLRSTLIPAHHQDPTVLAFIRSYVMCRNLKQAAAEAFITWQSGRALLNKSDIHACITKLTEASVFKFGLDPSELVQKVKDIADVDPLDIFNHDGSCRDMKDIPPETRRAIKKFKAKNLYGKDANDMSVVIGQLIEVEFWDKLKGAEMLGRETNLFKQTTIVEHDVTKNMKDTLLASRDRAEAMAIQSRERAIDVTPIPEDTPRVVFPEASSGFPMPPKRNV